MFNSIWRWASTGTAGSYRKWDIGEPDGEGGCARLTPYIQGVWRDWECDRRLLYVCKKFAGKSLFNSVQFDESGKIGVADEIQTQLVKHLDLA